MSRQLLMGNQAFAHAALEAGVNVVAGYPGTPSSEVIETVAQMCKSGAAHDVYVEWSTNEKAALEMLAGAAYCGARTLFTCKQVGMNVATDPLMSLNYVGIKGGMVLFVADDPGPISSQTEQDTRRYAMFAKVPVFDPATPEQGFAMIKEAFEISEKYHTPVIVRPTTRVCHASAFFDVQDETFARPIPEAGFEKDPKWIIFPARSFQAHGEINERLPQIANDCFAEPALAAFNPMEDVAGYYSPRKLAKWADAGEEPPAAELGILAGGISAAYAREALREVRLRAETHSVEVPAYRFLQLGTPYPFPEETVAAFTEGLRYVLVLEELDHVLEDELLTFKGARAGKPDQEASASFEVIGQAKLQDGGIRGENSTDAIIRMLCDFFDIPEELADPLLVPGGVVEYGAASGEDAEALPVRPPVLCAGCPHRGSFYAVKKALGKTDAVFCGDIGCYTLGNAAPLKTVDTCLCMGAGITMAQGFTIGDPGKKAVAFVGDSTLFASGLTGLVNAVYNQHDITVAVLDNATTAMTGAQPHPGTGVTLTRGTHPGIDIEGMLRAIGFECVEEANPLVFEEAKAAAAKALEFEGPSAIIFRSPCVQLTKPAAPASVDPDVCTGCRRCINEIGCPAIGFRADEGKRGVAFVDTNQCNGCGLCTQLCPAGALALPVAEGEKGGRDA